jgi:hypothetical protein
MPHRRNGREKMQRHFGGNPAASTTLPPRPRSADDESAMRINVNCVTGNIMRHVAVTKAAQLTSLAFCILAISAFAGAPAHAQDAGTSCCADLDQRVAELEATTARKGNRALKVTLTGLVNNAIMAWDDGGESNAYVVTNDNQRSRFAFVGTAAIDSIWEAGYAIDIGIRTANSKLVTQTAAGGFDERPPTGFDLRSSVWYLRNKYLGTGYLGTTFAATDRIASSNVTQTESFDAYSAPENAGLGMFLRSSVNGQMTNSLLSWRRIIGAGGDQPGESQRGFSLMKYVSPTWNGFTFAADWVVTDFWDVALRYRKEFAGFDFAAGIGYLQLQPGSRTRAVCPAAFFTGGEDATACEQLRGSVSAKHLDTGLFVSFGANLTSDGIVENTLRFRGTGVDQQEGFLSGQAGIERQWNALGKTTIYGDYYAYSGGAPTVLTVGPGDSLNPTGLGTWTVWDSKVNMWGGGIAQGIDSAAMILYLTYRHVSGDITLRQLEGRAATGPLSGAPIDDLDLLLSGAVIRF